MSFPIFRKYLHDDLEIHNVKLSPFMNISFDIFM